MSTLDTVKNDRRFELTATFLIASRVILLLASELPSASRKTMNVRSKRPEQSRFVVDPEGARRELPQFRSKKISFRRMLRLTSLGVLVIIFVLTLIVLFYVRSGRLDRRLAGE